MKDSIRIPGTRVKVKSTSHLHEGVVGTVDKDYDNTIQIRVEKEYEKHRYAYRSRIGHFDAEPGQSYKEFREGKFIMAYPNDLREIPKDKEANETK